MMLWEYRIVVLEGNAQFLMNQLGLEGWELVALTLITESRTPHAYFKRQLICKTT